MNIRVKAALLTAGIVAGGVIIFLAIGQILNGLTSEQIASIIMVGSVGVCVYMLYCITLDRLEYEARIKEIRDQRALDK